MRTTARGSVQPGVVLNISYMRDILYLVTWAGPVEKSCIGSSPTHEHWLALEEALGRYGTPEILNTNQGS